MILIPLLTCHAKQLVNLHTNITFSLYYPVLYLIISDKGRIYSITYFRHKTVSSCVGYRIIGKVHFNLINCKFNSRSLNKLGARIRVLL